MTADVIRIERVPRRMECCECDGDEFSLHFDGTIRCWNCDGVINAKWVKSSSQPTDGVPSDAA